jgi:hypothetical protein
MSIFHPARLTCSVCGTVNTVERNASVNADRRPDLRQAIIDGTFQAEVCTKCATGLRIDPHLTYLDLRHGLWIGATAPSELDNWPAIEADTRVTYDSSFGKDAPQTGRSVGEGLSPRLVFGWSALREKLICASLGLDDVVVEMVKMAVLRNVDDAPIADQTELRLMSGDEAMLNFMWINTLSEERLSALAVPRDLYDGIRDDALWLPMRVTYDGALFVDLNRFVRGTPVADVAA